MVKPDSTEDLDPELLFYLGCREGFRDGKFDSLESKFLRDLATSLRISPEKTTEIALRAKQDFRDGKLEPGGSLRPVWVFRSACRLAWADHHLSDEEQELLAGLAKMLQISATDATQIFWSEAPPDDEAPAIAEAVQAASEEPEVAPSGSSSGSSAVMVIDETSPDPKDFAPPMNVAIAAEVVRWRNEGVIGSLAADHILRHYQAADTKDPHGDVRALLQRSKSAKVDLDEETEEGMIHEASCPETTYGECFSDVPCEPREDTPPEDAKVLHIHSQTSIDIVGPGTPSPTPANVPEINKIAGLSFLVGFLLAAGVGLIVRVHHMSTEHSEAAVELEPPDLSKESPEALPE